MEFLKRVLCLLLVFSFTFQGVVAQTAAPTAGGEETETPQNPPGTPPGVTCSNFGEKPLPPHGVCCVGLVPDVGGFCDEPALVDNSLVSCTDASSCGQGMGCLPQTVETLFSRLAPSTTPVDEINEQKQHLEAQVEDIALKDTDQSCRHHKECHSYSCVAGKCEDKKVCRMAGEGEAAPSGVNCGPDLIRNQSGICEPSPEARNTVYLGLLKEATLRPLSQCQFEVSNEMREKSIVAMKSLRAMEYFFSTVSLDFQEECFQVMPLLKHEVGTVMFESRKNILRNFTEILNQIEKDYATILAASQSYTQSLGSNGNVDQNSNTVAVHRDVDQTATNFVVHNEPISQADLGSRLTSGYDAMMIMYRRNLLFQAYEQAMFEVLKLIGPKITGLSTNMKDWNDGDTSWNIGTRTVNSYSCEGSKYKKKKKWKWTTKYYNSIKDRWTNYYEVTGNAEANANIVKRENVARVLGLLSGFEEKSEEAAQADAIRAATEKAIEDFTSPKFYLIDPLLFAGMKHGQYGQAKSLAKKGGFLGFSGFKDLRHAYSIKGDAAGSFTRIHGDVTTRVRDFYKTL